MHLQQCMAIAQQTAARRPCLGPKTQLLLVASLVESWQKWIQGTPGSGSGCVASA